MRLEVMVEGKREVVHTTPMMTLTDVLREVSTRVRPNLEASRCELRVKGKPVREMDTPLRFMGLATGAKLVVCCRGGAERGLPRGQPQSVSEEHAMASQQPPSDGLAAVVPEARTQGAAPTPPARGTSTPGAEASSIGAGPSSSARASVTGVATVQAPQRPRLGIGHATATAVAYTHTNEVRVFSADAFAPKPGARGGGAAAGDDVPDDAFYDFTVEDFARLEQSKKQSKKDKQTALTTKKQREEEDRRKMAGMPPVIIRLVLPDGVLVETTFRAADPVSHLFAFVKGCMVRS